MNNFDLAKELKKHTDVVESTFINNNLQLINFNIVPYGNNAECQMLIEVSAINGTSIPDSLKIKANLYDSNSDIFITSSATLFEDEFGGYDTITIYLYEDERALEKASSGRLFVTRA